MTRRADTGFTLLELLVVLAILAAMMLIAPRLTFRHPQLNVRMAASRLAADLRLLHQQAMAQGEPMGLDLTEDGYRLRPDLAPVRFGGGMTAQYVPQAPNLVGQVGQLRFFPDGSATGGVVIIHDGRSAVHIDIDWLDGQVATHAR